LAVACERDKRTLRGLPGIGKLERMDPLLTDLKEFWRVHHARHRFNPMVKELAEFIRKHDPAWDDGDGLRPKPPTFNVFMPGAKTPTRAQ
jgi:hypothetical protein